MRSLLGRLQPPFAFALAGVILVAAAPAVAGALVTGKGIKDGSVTGKDVKDRSLSAADFRGSVRGPAGAPGTAGARGPQGPPGPAGASGARGPAGLVDVEVVATDKVPLCTIPPDAEEIPEC